VDYGDTNTKETAVKTIVVGVLFIAGAFLAAGLHNQALVTTLPYVGLLLFAMCGGIIALSTDGESATVSATLGGALVGVLAGIVGGQTAVVVAAFVALAVIWAGVAALPLVVISVMYGALAHAFGMPVDYIVAGALAFAGLIAGAMAMDVHVPVVRAIFMTPMGVMLGLGVAAVGFNEAITLATAIVAMLAATGGTVTGIGICKLLDK